MKMIFLCDKDNYKKGTIADIDRNSFDFIYYTRKGCIQPFQEQKQEQTQIVSQLTQGKKAKKKGNKKK